MYDGIAVSTPYSPMNVVRTVGGKVEADKAPNVSSPASNSTDATSPAGNPVRGHGRNRTASWPVVSRMPKPASSGTRISSSWHNCMKLIVGARVRSDLTSGSRSGGAG